MSDTNNRREALRLADAITDLGAPAPTAADVIARATAYLAFLEGAKRSTTDAGAEVQPEATRDVSGASAPVTYTLAEMDILNGLDLKLPGLIGDAHVVVHLYGIRRSEWAALVSEVADVVHERADRVGFDVSCSGTFGSSGDDLVAADLLGGAR